MTTKKVQRKTEILPLTTLKSLRKMATACSNYELVAIPGGHCQSCCAITIKDNKLEIGHKQ